MVRFIKKFLERDEIHLFETYVSDKELEEMQILNRFDSTKTSMFYYQHPQKEKGIRVITKEGKISKIDVYINGKKVFIIERLE